MLYDMGIKSVHSSLGNPKNATRHYLRPNVEGLTFNEANDMYELEGLGVDGNFDGHFLQGLLEGQCIAAATNSLRNDESHGVAAKTKTHCASKKAMRKQGQTRSTNQQLTGGGEDAQGVGDTT